MFDRVWSVVVEGTYRKTDARLYGYQRRKIRGETYPALIPGTDADQVTGVVYLNIGQRDVARLDRFEGAYYSKKEAICLLPNGSRMSAWVYVFNDKFIDLVEPQAWDPTWFEKNGLRAFMTAYQGYRWVDDTTDETNA